MKRNLLVVLSLCSMTVLVGCKSRESAYKQAWEKAQAQQTATDQNEQQVVTTPVEEAPKTVVETPVTPAATPSAAAAENADVRTIPGGVSVTKGNPLKVYSVVVGSFVTQVNAEDLMSRLQGQGYDSRVVRTNETINGQTGWYRVIASSYDDKASAVQSRDGLREQYPDAWLLYRK